MVSSARRRAEARDRQYSPVARSCSMEQLTETSGEGMVVKPRDVIATTTRGISQPGIKCRGPEYLRIIYGAEYTEPHHLDRLRQRGLGHKRSLAVREYALGIEALERTARRTRTALPNPRVRLRSPRARERTGRPKAFSGASARSLNRRRAREQVPRRYRIITKR
jgi:hypothetical protein